jgi:hypothetical protein
MTVFFCKKNVCLTLRSWFRDEHSTTVATGITIRGSVECLVIYHNHIDPTVHFLHKMR